MPASSLRKTSGIPIFAAVADFFLDADVDPRLGESLVGRGHTFRTTRQESRLDATDDVQLLIATDLRRLLVTHNEDDFLLLYRAWRSLSRRWHVQPGDHAGIIVVPQPVLLPLERCVLEIHNLVRGQRDVWGRFFVLDAKWGWALEP